MKDDFTRLDVRCFSSALTTLSRERNISRWSIFIRSPKLLQSSSTVPEARATRKQDILNSKLFPDATESDNVLPWAF